MAKKGMTYKSTGVDYEAMDPFKVLAQKAAIKTSKNIERFGMQVIEETRGESVQLIRMPNGTYLGQVEEGIGTKPLVADAMYLKKKTEEDFARNEIFDSMRRVYNRSFYDQIAQCTAAMKFNDMLPLGVLPATSFMHLAVGDSKWFNDPSRIQDLVDGWGNACNMAGCAWLGGETPTLVDVIYPDAVVLAGSTVGFIWKEEHRQSPSKIQHGDAILFVLSPGIGANGLTMARRVAKKLPKKYMTKLSDGRFYGEALLDPTEIYVQLIQALQGAGVELHYGAPITGHGARKLMRANQPFDYVVENIPQPHPVFQFIQENGPVDNYEAYGNLNMGIGYVLYLPNHEVKRAIEIARMVGQKAMWGGYVQRNKKNQRRVIIEPKKLVYEGSTLQVR